MTEVNIPEKSIGEQVADLLLRKPKNYDVTFSVGPQKIKVEAVKILLKAASPVFEEEFDQNWEKPVVKESEGIPLPDIEPVFLQRWAEYQCQQRKIEGTGENLREVLGSSFFEIRFPTMKLQDFTKVSVFKKNLFRMEEKLAVYDFIGSDEDEKAKYDKSQLPFKTNLRNSHGYLVLRLPKQFKVTENPPFVCNGTEQGNNWFQVDKNILLFGLGFLGPIGGDTHFDVTVQIKKYVKGSYTFDSGTFQKNIFARKGKIFYFLLDKPIVIEASTNNSSWQSFYRCYYSLKGSINVPQYKAENPKDESLQIAGVEFILYCNLPGRKPLAELLFKTN